MTLEGKNMAACFVNTEQEPIKVEHICFNSLLNGEDVILQKVEEVFFPHPQSEEFTVSVVQVRNIGRRKQNSYEAAPYMLLYYAQENAHRAR